MDAACACFAGLTLLPMPIFFAFITMLCYGTDILLVRKGLIKSPNAAVAAFITLSVNACFFLIYVLITEPLASIRLETIYYFIIAGVMAPGLARVFNYKAVQKVGVSLTAPIVNSEILIAVAMAVIILNEPMNVTIGTGVLSVVGGLAILGRESGKKPGEQTRKIRYRYLVYPFVASFLYGSSIFLRKLGLNNYGSPVVGALVTSGTSWLVMLFTLVASRNLAGVTKVKKESLPYFILGGCLTSIGWYALFNALHIGRVGIVTPIAVSYSLVTMSFSYFFLRDVEIVNKWVVCGTLFVVGGILLLCLGT